MRREHLIAVEVTLLYFDGCPTWRVTEERLAQALALVGSPQTPVTCRQVTTPEAAERWGFRGSPTVLIDGRDAFAAPDAPVGLACRLYATPHGPAGAPTVEQLVAALASPPG